MSNKPQSTEAAEEAWDRACKFMRDSVSLSVGNVGEKNLAHDLRTYPLPPYVPPIPKEMLDA